MVNINHNASHVQRKSVACVCFMADLHRVAQIRNMVITCLSLPTTPFKNTKNKQAKAFGLAPSHQSKTG